MDQKKVNRLVGYLNRLDEDEVEFVKKTITRARHQKVDFSHAAQFARFDAGQKVSFKDYRNLPHTGLIKKVNQKYIDVVDTKTKKRFVVSPAQIVSTVSITKGTTKIEQPSQ